MRMFSPQTLDEVLPTVGKVILLLERMTLPDTSRHNNLTVFSMYYFGHDTFVPASRDVASIEAEEASLFADLDKPTRVQPPFSGALSAHYTRAGFAQ